MHFNFHLFFRPSFFRGWAVFILSLRLCGAAWGSEAWEQQPQQKPPPVRIARLISGKAVYRTYPTALPSLVQEINTVTTLALDDQPVLVQSFEDPVIFECPLIFVNFGDREDWTYTEQEKLNLRKYLAGGGFIHVDAGITAEFLQGNPMLGQHHSFGEWEARKDLREAFATVFPKKNFEPLPRSHPLYRSFYKGLPDPSILPDTVREFVVQEKWPEGTFSAVALRVDGRIAVLATPIISMGWGRNVNGGWENRIAFRIREGADGLSDRLSTASYGGERFETTREDQRKDVIFCQEPGKPAWVAEPDGRYRLFRYYQSQEISDFAHEFFTRLGVNIVVFAATE